MNQPTDPLIQARASAARNHSRVRRATACGGLAGALLGLTVMVSACDVEQEPLEEIEFTTLRSGTNKSQLRAHYFPPGKPTKRPSWGTDQTNLCNGVSGNWSRDHMISWGSILDGYIQSLNPTGSGSCEENLESLYRSVRLNPSSTPHSLHIKNACKQANLSNDGRTCADTKALGKLFNSIDNLRCGYSPANSSISDALDVPCDQQEYVDEEDNERIIIKGDAAQQITRYLEIEGHSSGYGLYLNTVDSPCTPYNGAPQCDNIHIQSSDCSSDSGDSLAEAKVPVYLEGESEPLFEPPDDEE